MPKHEHFEQLASLVSIGDLAPEEYRELTEHLQGCESCRQAADRFDFILDQLPLPEPTEQEMELQQLQSKSYRERFLKRASSEGVHFTRALLSQEDKKKRFAFFQQSWRPFAFGMATTVALMTLASAVVLHRIATPPRHVDVVTHQPSPPKVDASAVTTPRDDSTKTIANLRQSAADTEKKLSSLHTQLVDATAAKQKLEAQVGNDQAQMGRLQNDNQQTRQQLAAVTARVQKLDQDNAQLTASLVEQQVRIRQLTEDVQVQMAAVEREKQLTAVAKDVRELMGARSLHIVDVADLNREGKPKKSFGRVFYTEGKSLIFYAFDLSQKGSVSKVTFQAWGQSSGSRGNVTNLGVFHIDDQLQKRWVLRVTNPELLKSVEAVFVTIEPSPGRDRPSGEKLLYAYLGTQANHP